MPASPGFRAGATEATTSSLRFRFALETSGVVVLPGRARTRAAAPPSGRGKRKGSSVVASSGAHVASSAGTFVTPRWIAIEGRAASTTTSVCSRSRPMISGTRSGMRKSRTRSLARISRSTAMRPGLDRDPVGRAGLGIDERGQIDLAHVVVLPDARERIRVRARRRRDGQVPAKLATPDVLRELCMNVAAVRRLPDRDRERTRAERDDAGLLRGGKRPLHAVERLRGDHGHVLEPPDARIDDEARRRVLRFVDPVRDRLRSLRPAAFDPHRGADDVGRDVRVEAESHPVLVRFPVVVVGDARELRTRRRERGHGRVRQDGAVARADGLRFDPVGGGASEGSRRLEDRGAVAEPDPGARDRGPVGLVHGGGRLARRRDVDTERPNGAAVRQRWLRRGGDLALGSDEEEPERAGIAGVDDAEPDARAAQDRGMARGARRREHDDEEEKEPPPPRSRVS